MGESDPKNEKSKQGYLEQRQKQKIPYNPPDAVNPDAATLRDQWKYATRQYAKWYSHAWGTAILAGLSFFALGWVIKGENPLLSLRQSHHNDHHPPESNKPS